MFTPVPSEDQPHGIMDFVFIRVFSQRLSPLGFPTYEKVDGVDTLWKTTALSFICLRYIFLILMCNLTISGLHQIFFVFVFVMSVHPGLFVFFNLYFSNNSE